MYIYRYDVDAMSPFSHCTLYIFSSVLICFLRSSSLLSSFFFWFVSMASIAETVCKTEKVLPDKEMRFQLKVQSISTFLLRTEINGYKKILSYNSETLYLFCISNSAIGFLCVLSNNFIAKTVWCLTILFPDFKHNFIRTEL